MEISFEQTRQPDIAPAREVRRVDHHTGLGVERTGRANAHSRYVDLTPCQLDEPLDQMDDLAVAGLEPFLGMSGHDLGLHQMPVQGHQPSCYLCSPNVDTYYQF